LVPEYAITTYTVTAELLKLIQPSPSFLGTIPEELLENLIRFFNIEETRNCHQRYKEMKT